MVHHMVHHMVPHGRTCVALVVGTRVLCTGKVVDVAKATGKEPLTWAKSTESTPPPGSWFVMARLNELNGSRPSGSSQAVLLV